MNIDITVFMYVTAIILLDYEASVEPVVLILVLLYCFFILSALPSFILSFYTLVLP